MQFEIYQWLVPLIGVFYLVRTVRQFYRNKRSLRATVVWCFFWLTIILLAIIPNAISHKIAEILGFRNNVNAIIFVALGLLFLFVFYLSATVERLDKQLTELVRRTAIQNQRLLDKEKLIQEKEKDEDTVRA